MEIRPTTIVKLFSGVPLNNTYTDTLYFSSLSAQSSYFAGLTPVKTFTSQMYQRVNKGQFEANCKADDIYNCNYMAFQNSGFGNKWFYAFINSIEYINNNNSLVTFEIDVMQTWMFDYELKRCFIERQHEVNDQIGINIEPEPFNIDEYYFDDYRELEIGLRTQAIIAMIVETPSGQVVGGGVYDNIYSGATLYAYTNDNTGWNLLNTKLGSYIQKPEAVVNLYMCPTYLLPSQSINTDVPIAPGTIAKKAEITLPTVLEKEDGSSARDFGTYTPKNNKLYTYPYCYLHVDNGNSASLALRYEFFRGSIPPAPHVMIDGGMISPVQLTVRPCGYKGLQLGSSLYLSPELTTETLSISGFPLCSWNMDTYRAWLAQNSVPLAIQGAGALAKMGIGIATGSIGVAMLGKSIISDITNVLTESYKASIAADICKGNVNSGNVNFSHGKMTFFVARARISMQKAEVIDSFFTMFGYAYNKVGVPNRSSRPHWNYVKTNGCIIIGECPADDAKLICSIYDNGITFWKNASEVGNYNLDNSPT